MTALKLMGAMESTIAARELEPLTPHGKKLASLPLSPHLGHMVVRGAEDGDGLLAGYLAVLLTEHGLGGRDVDLRVRAEALVSDRSQRAASARGLAERLARAAGARDGALDLDRTGPVLARAFPDRVAKSRGSPVAKGPSHTDMPFLLNNGRAAALGVNEALSREKFLVVADATGGGADARILAAAAITQAEIEAALPRYIVEQNSVTFDAATGAVRARRVRRLNAITFSETPVELSGAELEGAMLGAVEAQGLDALNWDDAATQAQARVALLRGFEPDGWPDWSDEALLASAGTWLAPALTGARSLRGVDVERALMASLPYELKRRLDADAPTHFETPAGSSLRIDYAGGGGPALDVRLQELFGLDKHPSVAGGRVPLTLRLLSPAHRPVQTTKDLPGFWRGSYASVRADMRGRYPKHPWPEDPLTAPPTRRAKPRGS